MILDQFHITHFFMIFLKKIGSMTQLSFRRVYVTYLSIVTFKIMYSSLLYLQEPPLNDSEENMDQLFFRHFMFIS